MPTAFDALARNGSSGSSSTSSEEDEINQDHRGGHQNGVASSCFYEDLTTQRADEETVLDAVYGDDFSKEDGVWGCPILSVHVRPSDIEEKRIGTELTLKVQLVKKYPSVSPSIELSNVKGLNAKEQRNLLKMLKNKCRSLAASSVVMVCELVLIVEDFLFSHNKDPTLSSWDLMNAREEEKKKVAQEAERRLDFMREDGSPSALRDSVYDQQHSSNNNIDKIEKEKIEREYARQMEALKADEEDRRKRLMSQDYSDGGSDTNDISFDGEDDDDDFEFNESYDDNNASSSSRYKSDFIELGHLGKGGGGEVVKARNRLDRRTYAVKKVVLQLERGNFEKSGKLENAKLKREVTTISRMTHKNIVRYYQAWVEGGGKCEERNSHGDSGGSESQERKIESCASEKSSESSSEESESSRSNQGFWTSNFSDESVDSSSSWSDEDEHTAATPQNCDDADFHNNFSPLLAGLGLGNPDSDLMKRYQKSRTNESSNIFGESDSEMDPSQINDGSRSILYIQMEYCSTTLRRLIDDTSLQKMEKGEVWKLVRQMLEALVYIHKRKVIHRDLKPGNVFLDAGNNIRLGDFGLATTRKSSRLDDTLEDTSLRLDDISHLIGDPLHSTTSNKSNIADDTITGGVGTRFYCAPEQEGRNLNVTKGRPSYDTKADIFSLGIVLFEMFHPPFSTMMHRAETLEQLRASSGCYSTLMNDIPKGNILDNDLWKEHARLRFPEAFRVTFCPENAQKLILWCLQHDATKRPSAEDILKSDLIPQLENRNEVLKAMFDRQTVSMSNEIDITWDTDAAAKVREHFPMSGKNSLMNSLLDNLREFASFSGKDKFGLQSSAMNCVAMMAANTALKRASHAGKIRGAPHYTASILAMAAATTSASTGHADGFLPRLTDSICNQLTKIFQSHGAVELKPPLLRPKGRIENGKDGHVEVMNERGIILLLPEDLTASFARSIGRAGGIGVKRYDIDKTFHKSKVGGHPRESLEASFDIVLEGANAHSNIFEAEVILVICQVMRNFVNHLPSVTFSQASTPKSNPFWFLRLTHTRLADAILDVCDVPTKESTRRACLHILTRCSAPPPSLVLSDDQTENLAKSKFKKQNSSEDNRSTPEEILDNLLEKAVQEQGLTKVASENLRTFLTNGCLPLPSDVTEALENLQEATKKVRLTNDKSKRSKRYFDIARGIKAIQNLINMMNEMGISPSNHGCQLDGTRFLPPVYISLDLGLRQRQKHFQGNLYFQALLLPDNCKEEPSLFDENNTLLSGNPKTAIKIAEGGHYEELVRKFRPPGNFGSIQLDKYTSAPIPMCVGTRIFVRRLAERAYFEASFTARMESHTTRGSLSNTGTESIRRSLGHPLAVYSCVQCMIVGMNGFDSETLQTRAAVAARLWSEDISAEYVPQSGVMTSLLKHTSTPNFMSETSDWTVDQIGGICGLLKIPFLVIVQDHLLRDKGCVRLRIVQDSHPNISPIEYVRLSVLASVMKDHLQRKENSFQSTENNVLPDRSKVQTTNQDFTGSKSTSVDVECIFIDSDQFYLDVDNLSGRDPKSKSIKKIVKTSTQRVESYLENLCSASTHGEGCTVLAVKIPFMVLREFDSAAMFGDGPTVVISVSEILSKYPKHRKALKTLAMCLDHLLRRQHESSSADMNGKSKSTETKKSSELFSALVYSIQDDRFDLLTLSHTSNSLESASHHEGSSGTPSTKSRRERNRR